MKRKNTIISTIVLTIFMAISLTVNATTKVTSIDDNTLSVVIYNGKPPHKRFIVKKDRDPSRYEYYSQHSSTSDTGSRKNPRHFRGAPGKN